MALPQHLSPSVEIRENDFSTVPTTPTGTTVLIPGFAEQGPTGEPTYVSSLQEYEEIFGQPTCPATRYSYNAVKQVVTTSPGNVLFTRMSFGSGGGYDYSDQYSALIYPIVGVSAVEKNVCEYYRNVDENTCKVSFPELYNTYFVSSALCYGSANLECPLNSQDQDPGYLYIHDRPVEYDSVLTGFKFVVDSDTDAEDLRVYQLRPNVINGSTEYTVVTSITLSSVYNTVDEDQSNLSNDSKRLLVNLQDAPWASTYTVSQGFLSGHVLSGLPVSAGDIFGTYSEEDAPVLKYFNSTLGKTYKTGTIATGAISLLSSPLTNVLSGGYTFTVANSAKAATDLDFLISFCATPVVAGLACDDIESLGLKIPEKDRYDFYPLAGDAQLNDANFYVIGEPITKNLNAGEYELLQNNQFNWKCGVFENVDPALDVVNNDVRAGIVVVNDLQAAQKEDFTGYYLALNDNLNINPSTDFDSLTGVAGYYQERCPGISGEWIDVPQDRWNFKVSDTFSGTGSIAEIVENTAGPQFATKDFNDSLAVSLFRLKPSRLTQTINKLDAVLVEKYVGSLNKTKKITDEFGGPPRSGFIEDAVNSSRRIKVFVNPYLSENNCWNDNSGVPQKTIRMYREKTATVFDNFDAEATLAAYGNKLYGVGSYTGHCNDALYTRCQKKDIGNLPLKLERALMTVENPLDYPVDIVIDGGLSTIWATRQAVKTDHCITDPNICYYYDDTYFVDTDSLSQFEGTNMASTLEQAWTTVANVLVNFSKAGGTRYNAGDAGVYAILDPLRQTLVNGKDYKVVNRQKKLTLDPQTGQPTERYSTFARNIYSPLKNLTENINTSYGECDGDWIKSYDSSSDSYSWYGPSAFIAAKEATKDALAFPWTPGFGATYGKLSNVIDIAINPNLKERDLLSRIGINPIVKFPEGYLVYNSLTLNKSASSALNENYIRRGLLWLEKALIATARPFIGLPNTITTRTRLKNAASTVLQYMKDNGGLNGYQVICTGSNGTINLAVYVEPVYGVKHILITVNVTKDSAAISELL